MKAIFNRLSWFYIPWIIVSIAVLFVILLFSKSEIHIWINIRNSTIFDIFFKYITNLGDGWIIPLLSVILLFKNYKLSILLIASFLLSGLVVQLLKHLVFDDALRPIAFFGDTYKLHLIDNFKNANYNSFPSGHTATAFSIGICFSLLIKNKLFSIAMFILACTIAYSRVYLSQHFLIDILAGSFIGVVIATFCYYLFLKTLTKKETAEF